MAALGGFTPTEYQPFKVEECFRIGSQCGSMIDGWVVENPSRLFGLP